MSRYFAAAGIGRIGTGGNDPKVAEESPRLVIIGPSGNLTSVLLPSGVASRDPSDADTLFAGENSFSHVALAWFRGEILTSFRDSLAALNDDYSFAWRTVPQPLSGGTAIPKVNDTSYLFEDGVNMTNRVMFDGYNWKQPIWRLGSNNQMWSYKRHTGGGIFWTGFRRSAWEVPGNYGLYDGKDPVFTGDKGGTVPPSGWRHLPGALGRAPHDVNYSAMLDEFSPSTSDFAGMHNQQSKINESTVINDIIEHNGTTYFVTQHGMVGLRFGAKGQFIWSEKLFTDTQVSDTNETAGYVDGTRITINSAGGSAGRVFAKHAGDLYMLSNTGFVHLVKPDTLIQVADLRTLGTPWSSGVIGGAMSRTGDSPYPGIGTIRRPYLASFNKQLHAFLAFSSKFRVEKGSSDSLTGRGVLWATSFDGLNWTDQSVNLPASGIISPSGGHLVTGRSVSDETGRWLERINPYRFSGLTGPDVTPALLPSGAFPDPYFSTPIGGANFTSGPPQNDVLPAQPSGFRQTNIPVWTSGNMIDPLNTSFDQLDVPLERGAISGFLFPTFIQYPEGFGFQAVSGGPLASGTPGALLLPSGVGPSGYDYTGVDSMHVSGFVDKDDQRLKLYFTNDNQGGTLFFELDQASGWHQKNYTPYSKQLNSLVPIMMYDPEVVIPSGGVLDPNPSVNEVTKTVTLKYKIHDWPFFDAVDVLSEYSLDYGESWSFIKRQKGLSTGSLETDPSGVFGTDQILEWKWTEGKHPLSKSVWYPHVQLRLRAIDPDYNPKDVAP